MHEFCYTIDLRGEDLPLRGKRKVREYSRP